MENSTQCNGKALEKKRKKEKNNREVCMARAYVTLHFRHVFKLVGPCPTVPTVLCLGVPSWYVPG